VASWRKQAISLNVSSGLPARRAAKSWVVGHTGTTDQPREPRPDSSIVTSRCCQYTYAPRSGFGLGSHRAVSEARRLDQAPE